jgi:hypothetical protein
MRTTIDIHDPLLEKAKQYAASHGQRLADVVNDALSEKLSREEKLSANRRAETYRVVPFSSAPMPGIDFDSNASIQDALDEELRDPATGGFDLTRMK